MNVMAYPLWLSEMGAFQAIQKMDAHLAEPDPHPQYEMKLTMNLDATVPPTVNDDSTQGYEPRSIWFDISDGEAYRCLTAEPGAAVWAQTTLTIDELGSAAMAEISDFATAAQGLTADSAVQPEDLEQIAYSGSYLDLYDIPLNATQTVDGYMAATDKVRLDGIEDNATRDQTAEEIRVALVTVDGTGSGLDADLIDGKELATLESEYKAYADQAEVDAKTYADTGLATKLDKVSYTAADVLAKLKTVDGATSGVDADLLDGLDSAQFVRSDIDAVVAGKLELTKTGEALTLDGGHWNNNVHMHIGGSTTYGWVLGYDGESSGSTGDGKFLHLRSNTNATGIRLHHDGGFYHINTLNELEEVWHAGNSVAYTAAEKTKVSGIAANAEVNVNADWTAVSGDAQILNKPTLGTAAAADTADFATAAQGTLADTAVQPGDALATPYVAVAASKTLALSDANKEQTVNSATDMAITLPDEATVTFTVGTKIPVLNIGAGIVSITASVGVTLNGVDGASASLAGQFTTATVTKIGADAWAVTGDVGAAA